MLQPTPLTAELWVSVKELANATGRSEKAIRELIYSGRLRHSRVGRAVRVRLADFQALHDANVVEDYKPDPVRSERARRRALDAGAGK